MDPAPYYLDHTRRDAVLEGFVRCAGAALGGYCPAHVRSNAPVSKATAYYHAVPIASVSMWRVNRVRQ